MSLSYVVLLISLRFEMRIMRHRIALEDFGVTKHLPSKFKMTSEQNVSKPTVNTTEILN